MSALGYIKIVHTSDVHLGTDYTSLSPLRRRQRLIAEAFARVVDITVAERAHLFLIAGDLFDSNRPSDQAVSFVVEQLRRLPMPVVILPGNHDPYTPNSVYRRTEFTDLSQRVYIISQESGQVLSFPDMDLVVWGRPDTGKPRGYRPLEGIPPCDAYRWHVAVAHGHLLMPGMVTFSSYPIDVAELAGCGWDYVALGHWERFANVSQGDVCACYSGAPMSLIDGVSDSGYAAIVHLRDSEGVSIERRRVLP